jgi:RHS repeat-associated protein
MTNAGISVPLTDALGNVIAETGSAQSVTTSFAYEPYGKATQTGTNSGNSQQYTGRENDGTGLYYYRARYFSPMAQHFISEDPIGYSGGANTYAYTGGDPIAGKDPSGLSLQSTVIGAQGEAVNEAMAAAMSGQNPGSAAMSGAALGAATGAPGDGPAGAAASALGAAFTAPPGQEGTGAMKGALTAMAPPELQLPLGAVSAIVDRAAELIGKLAAMLACL